MVKRLPVSYVSRNYQLEVKHREARTLTTLKWGALIAVGIIALVLKLKLEGHI